MKFLIGFALGATFSRPVLILMERNYGHILVPKLEKLVQTLADRDSSREGDR